MLPSMSFLLVFMGYVHALHENLTFNSLVDGKDALLKLHHFNHYILVSPCSS